MKRPESHEIDIQARRLFEGKLPKEWVSRYQSSDDYGIDYEIEVFRDKESTGIIFKVQLKGTKTLELTSKKDEASLSISVNSIKYWVEEIQIPTFLVLADINTGGLYWLSMKGNKEVKQKLQQAKSLSQKSVTLYIPLENKFIDKQESFLKDLNMAQADISACLISSIDTSSFVQASKDCHNQDEILKQLRFKSDALRVYKLEELVLQRKYEDVMKQCEKIYHSPTETFDLRFSALFEIDKAVGPKLFQQEKKRIEESTNLRLENAKRMRLLCKDNKDRLDLRIYAIGHYQALKILDLVHQDIGLFMNYCIHKEERPFWLVFLNIQRLVISIKVNRNIRRMFRLINLALKNRAYEIVPRLINELCENTSVYFYRFEQDGLQNEADKLRKYFDDAISLGVAIAENYRDYDEVARLYNSQTLIIFGKEKETKFAEAMLRTEKLPEFDNKQLHIELLQKHLQEYKKSLEPPEDEMTIEEEEKIFRSMIEAGGVDLETQNDAVAYILRIGLKDLNPERALRKCQYRFIKLGSCGLVGEMFRLHTAGTKVLYCIKHDRGLEAMELDKVDNMMNFFHCDKCPDKLSHADDWKWTRKWQMEQNDKYGSKFKK